MATNVMIGRASACWKAKREPKLRIRSVLRAMHVKYVGLQGRLCIVDCVCVSVCVGIIVNALQ